MKPVQLVLVPDNDDAWRIISVAGASARSPRCVLVVPGVHVLAREIDVAGATPAQSRAAALATLAPELATPADQLTCALGAPSGGRRIAFIASRARINGWLTAAKAQGLAPDAIIPDFMLLPAPELGQAHMAVRGEDVVVRTASTGFTCQHDLAEQLVANLTPVTIDFEPAAGNAMRRGAITTAPNLLDGMSATIRKAPARSALWPIAAAFIALAIATAAPWVSASRINGATAELRSEGDATARTPLPGASRIVDARAQLREAVLPYERTGKALNHATGILEGLAQTSGVQLSRLELDADGVMHASLAAADLSQLQPLRDHIARLGLRSIETPGESRPNSLSVDFAVADAS
jgi:general secretion pathway protein L